MPGAAMAVFTTTATVMADVPVVPPHLSHFIQVPYTGAIPHQHEVAALAAHLSFVALGSRLGAACGGAGFAPSLRLEVLGRRELVLGLRSRQRESRRRRGRGGRRAGGGDRVRVTGLSVRERVRALGHVARPGPPGSRETRRSGSCV